MSISIITDDNLQKELAGDSWKDNPEISWLPDVSALQPADVCIDLLFVNDPKRINDLKNSNAGLIIINGVDITLKDLPENFARINAWPGFLKRAVIEIAARDAHLEIIKKTFSLFDKKTELVPDIIGFITSRVISMIINEAFFALEEKVSTKEEIDLAMKLGTNYPYGPFEWAQVIGPEKIYSLLDSLSKEHSRYKPAPLLKQESISG